MKKQNKKKRKKLKTKKVNKCILILYIFNILHNRNM